MSSFFYYTIELKGTIFDPKGIKQLNYMNLYTITWLHYVINYVIVVSYKLILTITSLPRDVVLDDFEYKLRKVLLSYINPKTSGYNVIWLVF
jgi:hypothetical protein